MDDNNETLDNEEIPQEEAVGDLLGKLAGLAQSFLIEGFMRDTDLDESSKLDLVTFLRLISPEALTLAVMVKEASSDEEGLDFPRMYASMINGLIVFFDDFVKITARQIYVNGSESIDKDQAMALVRAHADDIAKAREGLAGFSKALDRLEEETHKRTEFLAEEFKKGAS